MGIFNISCFKPKINLKHVKKLAIDKNVTIITEFYSFKVNYAYYLCFRENLTLTCLFFLKIYLSQAMLIKSMLIKRKACICGHLISFITLIPLYSPIQC